MEPVICATCAFVIHQPLGGVCPSCGSLIEPPDEGKDP